MREIKDNYCSLKGVGWSVDPLTPPPWLCHWSQPQLTTLQYRMKGIILKLMRVKKMYKYSTDVC